MYKVAHRVDPQGPRGADSLQAQLDARVQLLGATDKVATRPAHALQRMTHGSSRATP